MLYQAITVTKVGYTIFHNYENGADNLQKWEILYFFLLKGFSYVKLRTQTDPVLFI